MFGDVCTYPQFCVSGECQGTDTMQICTHDCSISTSDSCPMGYDCLSGGGDNGICFPHQDSSGCCSANGEGLGAMAGHGGVAIVVGGLLFGRRRRKVR
jgi:hypothetical protein